MDTDSINWRPLASSHLDEAAWLEGIGLLVRFKNGEVYQYKAPESDFLVLLAAPSPGQYLKRSIEPRFRGLRFI